MVCFDGTLIYLVDKISQKRAVCCGDQVDKLPERRRARYRVAESGFAIDSEH